METHRIPLFPLNVVLFPGMLLPLHVFEPRYRQMVQDCVDADGLFGVCLIRSGEEVGGPADPYPVGTTCKILDITPLGEGRMKLTAVGQRRFRIRRLIHDRPYLEAEVELLDEDRTGSLGGLPERVRTELRGYLERMLGPETPGELDLPHDPVLLSHLVGAVLQASLPEQQDVLATDSLRVRQERQLELLRQDDERLPRDAAAHPWTARRIRVDPGKLSLN